MASDRTKRQQSELQKKIEYEDEDEYEDDLVAAIPHRGLQGGSYDGPDLSARESS